MKKLASALEQASQGISSISGGKLAQQTPGELGVISSFKVDTGAPDESTTTVVGGIEPVAVIASANPDPEPVAKWPTENADTNKAIIEILVQSSRKEA